MTKSNKPISVPVQSEEKIRLSLNVIEKLILSSLSILFSLKSARYLS